MDLEKEGHCLWARRCPYSLRSIGDTTRHTLQSHSSQQRANAQFEKRREEYRLLICEVFAEYRQVLGAEKIWMILARRGHQVGAKFGADLMREMGLSRV